MTTSIADFFQDAQSGGSGGMPGAASFDFKGNTNEGIGYSVAGEIVDIFESQMTEKDPPHAKKFDKNGKAMKQVAVTLQTELRNWVGAKKPWTDPETNQPVEDTGLRKVYIRFQGARAVAEAIAAAGATFDDFVAGTGAKLYLKRIENDGNMNQFEARFAKGTKAPASDFLAEAAAPAQSAPPAAEASPWGNAPTDDEPPF